MSLIGTQRLKKPNRFHHLAKVELIINIVQFIIHQGSIQMITATNYFFRSLLDKLAAFTPESEDIIIKVGAHQSILIG